MRFPNLQTSKPVPIWVIGFYIFQNQPMLAGDLPALPNGLYH